MRWNDPSMESRSATRARGRDRWNRSHPLRWSSKSRAPVISQQGPSDWIAQVVRDRERRAPNRSPLGRVTSLGEAVRTALEPFRDGTDDKFVFVQVRGVSEGGLNPKVHIPLFCGDEIVDDLPSLARFLDEEGRPPVGRIVDDSGRVLSSPLVDDRWAMVNPFTSVACWA